MTVWGVGCIQWLGGALDRNNLESSSNDDDLAPEPTPDRRLRATDGAASPWLRSRWARQRLALPGARQLTRKNAGVQPWKMAMRSPDDFERSVSRTLLYGAAGSPAPIEPLRLRHWRSIGICGEPCSISSPTFRAPP